jgi:AraC-like DNA-binding protein
MNEKLRKLVGYGPYPFPEEEFDNKAVIDTYMGSGIIIVSTKGSLKIPKGTHCHSSYEFLVPRSNMSYSIVDNKLKYIEKDKIFSINPEQYHGQMREIEECRLVSIQIEKESFDEISHEYCKKRNIVFENESCILSPEINSLINMFILETSNKEAVNQFTIENLTNLIVANFIKQLSNNAPSLISEKKYCENENINRVIAYLTEEFNKDFSLGDIARIANLSPYYFIRIFKSMTGKTPYDYLLDIKIKKSKEFLKTDKYTITEIGLKCGFNSLEHFSSAFKRKVGMLPSQFRNNLKI